jgi:dynactin 1
VLETHRADDARRVRELEARLSEAESFVALRPKLQAKLQTQQTELIETRRELADARQAADAAEGRIVDAQEQLEMATLDKEMAEERAEAAEGELEEVRERLAMVEVELDVIKEERELDGEGGAPAAGGGDGKNTLAYIQLEKQNERLKEALVRLRDISQETDQEQRRRISEMEKDIMNIDDMQGEIAIVNHLFPATDFSK